MSYKNDYKCMYLISRPFFEEMNRNNNAAQRFNNDNAKINNIANESSIEQLVNVDVEGGSKVFIKNSEHCPCDIVSNNDSSEKQLKKNDKKINTTIENPKFNDKYIQTNTVTEKPDNHKNEEKLTKQIEQPKRDYNIRNDVIFENEHERSLLHDDSKYNKFDDTFDESMEEIAKNTEKDDVHSQNQEPNRDISANNSKSFSAMENVTDNATDNDLNWDNDDLYWEAGYHTSKNNRELKNKKTPLSVKDIPMHSPKAQHREKNISFSSFITSTPKNSEKTMPNITESFEEMNENINRDKKLQPTTYVDESVNYTIDDTFDKDKDLNIPKWEEGIFSRNNPRRSSRNTKRTEKVETFFNELIKNRRKRQREPDLQINLGKKKNFAKKKKKQ